MWRYTLSAAGATRRGDIYRDDLVGRASTSGRVSGTPNLAPVKGPAPEVSRRSHTSLVYSLRVPTTFDVIESLCLVPPHPVKGVSVRDSLHTHLRAISSQRGKWAICPFFLADWQ